MSPQQLAANRANAQVSTGPTTAAGKARSSLNAYRHGLTGKIHTLACANASPPPKKPQRSASTASLSLRR
jgi:hypothetical protein